MGETFLCLLVNSSGRKVLVNRSLRSRPHIVQKTSSPHFEGYLSVFQCVGLQYLIVVWSEYYQYTSL